VLVDLAQVPPDSAGVRISVVGLVEVDDPVHEHRLRDLGVEVRSLGLRSRWDPRALSRAARVIRDLRPDLIHTHMKHADLVGAVVARRLGLPLVSTLHVIEDVPSPLGHAKRWLAGQVRRRVAARTIAVSEAQRRWYLETFPSDPERVLTVHNGVAPPRRLDDRARTAMREALGVPAGGLMAVNVAIMRPGKGHDDLLQAVARLPETCPIVVVLVGDGKERRRLESTAAGDERIRRRVRFAGYRDDVPALLQAADLVVHPSHADALPTALIHALGAGVPIIGTCVGGIPEVVGEAGILVPPHRPGQLAQALADLGADPARRAAMAAAGRARFGASFDARLWARRLAAVYEDAIRDGEPRLRRARGSYRGRGS
jgi:glycosyltransferase involved in cell wall biosynthesis